MKIIFISLLSISLYSQVLIKDQGRIQKFGEEYIYKLKNTIPDIIVQGEFGADAQRFLIKKGASVLEKSMGIQTLERNFDEYLIENKLKEEVVAPLLELLSEDTVKEGGVTGLSTNIAFKNLGYELKDYQFLLETEKLTDEGYFFTARINLTNIHIKVDRSELSFKTESERGTTTFLDDISLVLSDTELNIKSNESLALKLRARVYKNDSGMIKFEYIDSGVNLFEKLNLHDFQNEIEFIPGKASEVHGLVGIQVGGGLNQVQENNLNAALELRKVNIAKIMATPIVKKLKELPKKLIAEKVNKISIPNTIALNTSGQNASLSFNSFGKIYRDQFQINIDYFTYPKDTIEKVIPIKEFWNNSEDFAEFRQSQKFINDWIESDDVDLVMSFSDGFINNAMANAMNSKNLLDNLNPFLKIGDQKAIAVFDDVNKEHGVFVADGVLAPKKKLHRFALKLLTGVKELNIPLAFEPKFDLQFYTGKEYLKEFGDKIPKKQRHLIDFEDNTKKIPVFIGTIKSVDTSEEALTKGVYGITGNYSEIKRSKKLLLKRIRKEIKKRVIGQRLMNMPFVAFTGMDVDIYDMKSDGHGRLALGLKLDDSNIKAAKFWDQLIGLLKKKFEEKKEKGQQE